MATKKYVSLEKLSLYDEKIKKVIADSDATVLANANAFAESLAENYDAAGAAATVQGNLDTEVGRAKAREDEIAAANAATQGEVDALEILVGSLPEGTSASTIVGYVDAKTAGIATDAALAELNGQVSALQTTVQGIQDDHLTSEDKTELSDAIASEAERADAAEKANAAAIKAVSDDYLKAADKEELQGAIDGVAEDVAEIVADYLKAADKEDLQGKIDLKAAQTALDAEVERATAAEAGLQDQINTIMNNPDAEGAINSINEFTQYIADHGTIADGFRADIDKNKGDIAAMDTAYKAADSAIVGRLDVLEAIDHDAYKAADTALKNELNGEIAKKADTSAMNAAVEAINGDIAGLQAADAGIIERITAVEALMGDGDGSVADQIADVKAELQGELASAIADAKKDASDKDAVVLSEAQKAASAVQTNLDTHTNNGDIHVTAADKTKWNAALQTADIVVGSANGTISVKGSDVAVKGLGSAAFVATTAFDATGSAAQALTDANAYTDAAIAKFVEVSEEEINALFA